ncbi:TNF receptor-associated factor 6-like [Porites lutea]|uniref:TNF receptor-associated factor 6-like n=1 Tax=Porites lutea TaxID=51062 RepID=UPI003CC50178
MYLSQASAPSGYDEYFDPPLEANHECPICLSGLREPMQTSCGHRFCRDCILWSFRSVSHSCPVDNERLDENSLYPDNFAKREILCHDVFCRMKKEHGCTWKGPLKTIDDHMKVCAFVNICCPKNCGKQLQRKNAKQHLETECPNRTTPCEHCDKEVHWNGLENHFRTCPNFPVSCGQCGRQNIVRKLMEHHLDNECPEMEIKCAFSVVGCTFEGKRATVEKHVDDQLASHVMDLAKTFGAFIATQNLGTESRYNFPENVSCVARANNVAYSCDPMAPRHQQLKESNELKRRISFVSGEVENREYALNGPSSRRQRPLLDLDAVVWQLETKLLEFEGRVCNGTYIWRVENYRQRRQDAIANTMSAMYSPPFYTSLYGYKMCLRMNLNGVDSGLGKHIALFVHMMQGDYDDILEWPFFGKKINLSILDQSKLHCHISETLVVEDDLIAFQRPTDRRNSKGYGYVEFAPIDHIREPRHVKNNTMLVRVQIF